MAGSRMHNSKNNTVILTEDEDKSSKWTKQSLRQYEIKPRKHKLGIYNDGVEQTLYLSN